MSESTQAAELQARLRTGVELLRPHPHRGDLIAAGAVPLTVALLLVNLRLDDSWGAGIFLVLNALGCGLVLGMGVLAPMEEERPRAYQVVLQLAGLVLLFVTLLRLAKVLGSGDPLDSSGASFWILALVAAAAAWLARERRSAICTLVAGIVGILSALSFVDWAFSPDGPGTSRWILLLLALGLTVGALLLRDRHRRESVYLVDAAGFAVLVLGTTYLGSLVFSFTLMGEETGFAGPGAGWKLVMLAAGLGLVAYAGVDREAGPGYLGTLILLEFVVLVGNPGEGGPSIWFWPLVLLAIGGAMIAAGLRPREPLPPEPGAAAPVVPVPGAPAPPAPPRTPAPAPPTAASSAPAPPAPPTPAPPESPVPPEPSAPPASPPPVVPAPPAPAPPAPAPPAPAPPAPAPPAPAPPAPAPPAPAPAPPAPPRARPPAPEPPARGSLWARPDPGEQPTKPHRVPPPAPESDRDD